MSLLTAAGNKLDKTSFHATSRVCGILALSYSDRHDGSKCRIRHIANHPDLQVLANSIPHTDPEPDPGLLIYHHIVVTSYVGIEV